ncbi:MAG TPA: non-canonical purine NTP phosphatase [Chloroflexi bacterium]|nr:non-canonical purine NTP phosphatase [Chloroflexota bacterium]
MKKIVLASENPVKIEATLQGFQMMFPGETFDVLSVSVPSRVDDQPRSREETLQGALNRAQGAAERAPEADYWVGIEGGIEEIAGEMAVFAWIVVRSSDLIGKSQTGMFFLPPKIKTLIEQGLEMGEADDIVFDMTDSGQKEGAIGVLTENVIDRARFYQHAVILALVPFKNTRFYSKPPEDE